MSLREIEEEVARMEAQKCIASGDGAASRLLERILRVLPREKLNLRFRGGYTLVQLAEARGEAACLAELLLAGARWGSRFEPNVATGGAPRNGGDSVTRRQ